MDSCVNENCNKNPLNSLSYTVVNIDGDLACSPVCKIEYGKQKDHFLNHIVHDEEKCKDWILGK